MSARVPFAEFMAVQARKWSPELDFGVWWWEGLQTVSEQFRVSWVQDTGELYAFSWRGGWVEVLGVIHGRERIEAVLNGWADVCGGAASLGWVRMRVKLHTRASNGHPAGTARL